MIALKSSLATVSFSLGIWRNSYQNVAELSSYGASIHGVNLPIPAYHQLRRLFDNLLEVLREMLEVIRRDGQVLVSKLSQALGP